MVSSNIVGSRPKLTFRLSELEIHLDRPGHIRAGTGRQNSTTEENDPVLDRLYRRRFSCNLRLDRSVIGLG